MPRLYNCERYYLSGEINNKRLSSQKTIKKDFSTYKKNTINSINEIEHFLRNFATIKKSITIYKILK